MNIEIKSKDVELKFTFNSFRYMADFDIAEISLLETKPFLIIPVLEKLLLGAVNNDPKRKFTLVDVSNFLESYIEEGNSLTDLLNTVMGELQESNFFKALQMGNQIAKAVK